MSEYASDIVGALQQMGFAQGDHALTYTEIDAWMRLTGETLNAWEAETVHKLSTEFLSAYRRYHEKEHPPPFESPEGKAAREVAQDKRVRESWS